MVTRTIPVKAPLRFLPRGVGGKAEEAASAVGGGDSVSMQSAELWACETLSRESWDCVSAVGVSGMSSSSEMGDGMRLLRSSESMSCRGPFQAGGGACMDDVCMLFMSMPPAEPLAG